MAASGLRYRCVASIGSVTKAMGIFDARLRQRVCWNRTGAGLVLLVGAVANTRHGTPAKRKSEFSAPAHDQRNEEQDNEDQEQDLGDADSGTGDAAEAQDAGNQCDDEKNDRVMQHGSCSLVETPVSSNGHRRYVARCSMKTAVRRIGGQARPHGWIKPSNANLNRP